MIAFCVFRRKRKKAGRKGDLAAMSPYEKWMQNEENKSKGVVTPHFVAKDHKPVNPNASKLKDLHDIHGTSTFQKTLAEKVMAPKRAADRTTSADVASPKPQQQEDEADEYAVYEQQDDKIAGTWADEQPQYYQEETATSHAYGEQAPSYEGEHDHGLDAESTHNPVFQNEHAHYAPSAVETPAAAPSSNVPPSLGMKAFPSRLRCSILSTARSPSLR